MADIIYSNIKDIKEFYNTLCRSDKRSLKVSFECQSCHKIRVKHINVLVKEDRLLCPGCKTKETFERKRGSARQRYEYHVGSYKEVVDILQKCKEERNVWDGFKYSKFHFRCPGCGKRVTSPGKKFQVHGESGFICGKCARNRFSKIIDVDSSDHLKDVVRKFNKDEIGTIGVRFKCSDCGETTIKRLKADIEDFDNYFRCRTCNIKNTNQERYGEDFFSRTDRFHEKHAKTTFDERNSEEYLEHVVNTLIKPYHFDVVSTERDDAGETIFNVKCEFCGKVGKWSPYARHELHTKYPVCVECSSAPRSKQEHDLKEYIKSIYDGEIIGNTRSVIKPRELDLYFPGKNLAIEYDGLYFHNNVDNSDKFYECQRNGVRLVQITEYEWRFETEKIKAYLRNLFSYGQKRIYARKCTVKEIDSTEYEKFTEENHLQGYRPSRYKYGLFHDNELVEVIGLNKIKGGYELVRECSKMDTIVIGGKSKLLKHFREGHQGKILSYCEVAKFTGKSYVNCGFRLDHISKPNYNYYGRFSKCGFKKFSRLQCQKHKLKDFLGENFDQSKTEVENMLNARFFRIFDYGNYVFELP